MTNSSDSYTNRCLQLFFKLQRTGKAAADYLNNHCQYLYDGIVSGVMPPEHTDELFFWMRSLSVYIAFAEIDVDYSEELVSDILPYMISFYQHEDEMILYRALERRLDYYKRIYSKP